MQIFDSNVQELKYKVLREVARHTWEGNDIFSMFNEIAREVVRKDNIPMRCCIYKDRAIVADRIRIALGGDRKNPNIVEVIDIACDECPAAGYKVTELCRGCIAHKCEGACKVGAIYFDEELNAHIDKKKCVECGKCSKVCPFNAIVNFVRPCEKACPPKAIHMAETGEATIDHDKCTACGSCIKRCPFGAPQDKSRMTDVIHLIMDRQSGTGAPVHAIVAPAVATQFKGATLGQMVTALKALGFDDIWEAALGADIVAYQEAEELEEKGFLTTSCCPAFVNYIEQSFPEMKDKISGTPSPMAVTGRLIREKHPDAKVVFIGPCTAKKSEVQRPEVAKYVDVVITFEELNALLDSKDIDILSLEEQHTADASIYGRKFAKSGGVASAVKQALKEKGSDFEVKEIACPGLSKCKPILRAASKGKSPFNLIEGMACAGGCIGGAGCQTHDDDAEARVEAYGKSSPFDTIGESLSDMGQIR